jgi:uncharacterized protein (TIGR03086 family)
MATHASAESDALMHYMKATAHTRRLLDVVTLDQWEASTPCTDWNVKKLVKHMISGAKNAESIMRGYGPKNCSELFSEGLVVAFDAACKAAIAAFSVPGVMGTMVQTRRGEQLAGNYALGQVQEMLVHGWDLATAIGADTSMDLELLGVSYDRAVRSRDHLRSGGATVWGESEATAAENADTQTQYLAILGRPS